MPHAWVLARQCRAGTALAAFSLSLAAQTSVAQTSAAEALRVLKDGNGRYAAAGLVHPHQSTARRIEVASGQHPLAAILSCSDSRVAPEIIFDRGLGDLFTVRVAGNIADDAVLGSLEYAVKHLHVPLVLVVGHQKCGAVSAAIAGTATKTHIDSLIDAIQPSVWTARNEPGDAVENAVRANVLRVVGQLKSDANLHGATVTGAVYSLDTGKVTFLNGK